MCLHEFLCIAGVAAFVLQVATSKGTGKANKKRACTCVIHTNLQYIGHKQQNSRPWWSLCLPAEVSVSVWPPGSNIYVGECVLLQCTVESNSSFMWSYRWFRHKPHSGPSPNPRHLVSGDSYSIIAVAKEDTGRYWCQAERWETNTSSVVVLSQPAALSVSGEQQQLQPLQWGFSCIHTATHRTGKVKS